MNSSIPKPPQRIRVEMPAEIAPQPVPEAVLEGGSTELENAAPITNSIHVSHPGVSYAAITTNKEVAPIEITDSAEPEAEIAVSEMQDTALLEEDSLETVETIHSSGVVNVPSDELLFKRQYYTISEVANMFGANQSQIRFWENEFDILQPKKNKKGDRYFRPEDIKNLVLIHYLLKGRRFTIEGAREYLKRHTNKATNTHQAIQALEKVKGFLLEMKTNLAE